MSSTSDSNNSISRKTIRKIKKIVHERLQPLGFVKCGKILHRFVDGDISQVVCYKGRFSPDGTADLFWISLGIRVPECQTRQFVITEPLKEYYDYGECNLQSGLCGGEGPGTAFWLDGSKSEQIIEDITRQLEDEVIPAFETLSSRDNILRYRKDYPNFFHFHSMLVEEAMIWGRRGNLDEASRLFNLHYQKALAEYNYKFENGHQFFLHKGGSVHYLNTKTNQSETVYAPCTGYYTIFAADRGHLNYLEGLAEKLGINISPSTKQADAEKESSVALVKTNDGVLNITNGDSFNEYLLKKYGGEAVPFCEAMMDGDTVPCVYSDEFVALRARTLGVSYEEYRSKMHVYNALKKDYSQLRLWFGKDTFCQANLLTLLSYLEEIGYGGSVVLIYIDDGTFEIKSPEIDIKLGCRKIGFYKKIYEKILVSKCRSEKFGSLISKAFDLYFDYHSDDGALACLVRENLHMDDTALVTLLLEKSSEYGLSEQQAEKLIKKYRSE